METGLHGYDAARFEGAKATISAVCVRPLMSTLRQTMADGAAAPYDVTVPPFDRHVLIVARRARGVTEGRVDGKPVRFERRSGQVTLMPAGVDTRWASGAGAARDLMHVHLDPALFDDFEGGADLAPLVGQMQPEIVNVCGLLLDEVESGPPPALFWDSSARFLAGLLARRLGRQARGRAAGGLTPLQKRRLAAFIEARFTEDLTLGELAAVVDLSQFHFARAFRQSFGVPPHRYVTARRLEAAQQLLLDPALSVAAVAGRVGYQTPAALYRALVKSTGLTPSAFRRACA